ncbi:hypothetical protein BT96DRAFT_1011057 [Gymnopus androsaceus JB14]|uniref:IPT/TIG domain-containing protein n=1 Tax=Gymnopus androsaceus JB14 TaxID=1447944 RepID=A0A6A4IT09_9AGAR|nr:hypothetical protein BT96DRAFT_1011057 [Gymnopus androsaceus JB14]
MSSSSASRSPSPPTPSDPVDVDLDQPSWYQSSPDSSWNRLLKSEDSQMLQLDDLIEQHAYEEPQSLSDPKPLQNPTAVTFLSSMSKPVPSPVVHPRKPEHPSRNHKVVHPLKDSCYNLPIMFPSLPENGTKSRVETQVRVIIDLADPSSSTGPSSYNRVGSWKWLKLPPGTATKKRTRKQGKIDPDPQDMLYLTVGVSCATSPHNRVLCCSSCQTREAKRVAKKIAARVRPARSDSDSPDDPNSPAKKSQLEDTSSIIQFNCSEVIDFSTGSAVLPLRITCYCRHHREKTGFNVNLAMMDSAGRTVGIGSSSPIMITDDHKTTSGTTKHADLQPYDWCQTGIPTPEAPAAKKAPSKRKNDAVGGKKRAKPYDSSAKPNRGSREASVASSAPSETVSASSAPSPPSHAPSTEPTIPSEVPSLQYVSQESESSPDTLTTPLDMNLDIPMLPEGANFEDLFSNPPLVAPAPQIGVAPSTLMNTAPSSLPFLFSPPQVELTLSMPTIHRLIPNCGPTHGGIEVTVLGANFHPTLQFNCIFGDMPASSTQRWSDNTLVCILPPRATAGMVSVWFEGFPKVEEQPPSFFTYSDESDRALMELALQVVGLKMTGKIEDAKNVAMRIVGAGEGADSQNSNGHGSNMMQLSTASLASATATRDLRSLMLLRAGESEDFESLIHPSAQLVSAAKALSHRTKSGQSLLHLAAFLGYGSIVEFLVLHGIDFDMRDRNGYTALHFAAMAGSKDCVATLLRAGADHEIVNALGKTAEEAREFAVSDDEEAEWGDAEEEAEEPQSRRVKVDKRARRSRAASRKASREELKGLHSRRASNVPAAATPDGNEKEAADEKQALSFIDMLQRTMAQLPGAPQLPQFPLLPGVPAVPWEALHQLQNQFPMVFPVAVPLLPGWFNSEQREGGAENPQGDADPTGTALAVPFKAAQEWRALWEKWLALAPWQATEMPPPPQYTPRASGAVVEAASTTSTSDVAPESETTTSPPIPSGSRLVQDTRRRFDYNTVPVTDQEVKAYAYQPKLQQKKHDRMLLLFWLPILMISLIWACHSGLQFVIRAFRTPMAFKKVLGY